ncbi:hypothetical protein N0V93_004679 [Gnomoniopsis smithogilvyi]|uniref:Uncharacterized protein n=1 Tax=Gnomoniopsis smithogilvyi TaxID=1191159 RepID=A0A9W8YT30_9PEZI|nr:hypothetical protein N0V93_004679 [Gnomoniopsis smithogilvyi]
MSSIGEKIKGALTGHSQSDTSNTDTHDENTPRSLPSDEKKVIEGQTNLTKLGHHHRDDEIGAGHTKGRHDPEVDAKEATSQAGNYPYWGDLPRDGEQGHTHEHGTASTSHNLTDRTRDTGLTSSTHDPASKHGHKGELAAATGVGAAGATYLGTRHRDDDNTKSASSGLASGPTQAGPGTLDPGYASQTTSSTGQPREVSNNAFGSSQYGTHDNTTSHRKEEGALAAGAAGLGGAGYLAHKRGEDQSRTGEQPTSTHGSQQRAFGLTSTGDNDPYSSTSTTTHGDNNNNNRYKEEAALAGAGVAGLGGAGYLAHKRGEEQTRPDDRATTVHGSQQRDTTSGFGSSQPQSTTGGIHNTVIGAGSAEDPHSRTHKTAFDSSPLSSSTATTVGPQYGTADSREQSTIAGSRGAPTSGNDREKQGLAAAAGVGAGAGVVAAEEKHRHHEHRQHDNKSNDPSHSVFGSSNKHSQPTQSSTTSQPSAQLAAQQAWSNQNQSSTGAGRHDPEAEARQATSAAGNYPYQGQDSSTSNTGHHHNNNAALGAAAGAGLAGAGATAAYYGQGREHDQNPRSDESQKIADRALGSDGAAHGPTSTQGQIRGATDSSRVPGYGQSQSTSGVGAAGLTGGSGLGSSKVLHKCHQCGADNDISNYFNKDAVFRTE